mgnify:CR=1 FL=1
MLAQSVLCYQFMIIDLDIAKSLTAEVFTSNGVDRIDGNIISSLTLAKETTKIKESKSVKLFRSIIRPVRYPEEIVIPPLCNDKTS